MKEEKKIKKSKAGVYLAVILVFVGVILLVMSFTANSSYNMISEQWEWQLTEGWNIEVTFTQAHLNACDDTSTETVFESIYDDLVAILHYSESEDHWYSWYKDRDPWFNDLTTIVPGEYNVHVLQDCVLTIGDPYIPPAVAITSNSWVTGVSGVFCIIAGMGIAVKTKWF